MDSLDTMLVGQMNVYVETVGEYGERVRYKHVKAVPGQTGELYLPGADSAKRDLSRGAAHYEDNLWTITNADGWKYTFPFRAKALKYQVTVLSGYADPRGQNYRMERDQFGDLLSVTSPDGQWLHFARDENHRVTRASASS
jgi:YD repeat-containing protein